MFLNNMVNIQNSWAMLEPLWTPEVQDSNHSTNSVCFVFSARDFLFPFTMAQPAQGVVAPEGYHEPSLQRKDADASSHLRQMMNGEWRLKFTAGESGEILGSCGIMVKLGICPWGSSFGDVLWGD